MERCMELRKRQNTLQVAVPPPENSEDKKSDYPKILKLFPNAELKYIEGAGHWLHSEKPAEFLRLTLDFLNKSH
ncbi:hypothetical protein JTB14_001225 [Gonioctena quinquepunctata]|nr:hypothetical protein JTB14_001225 [Gonioctena quinquepunctata]